MFKQLRKTIQQAYSCGPEYGRAGRRFKYFLTPSVSAAIRLDGFFSKLSWPTHAETITSLTKGYSYSRKIVVAPWGDVFVYWYPIINSCAQTSL